MNENKLLGLAWISPYIIGLILFTAFPFVSSFFLSFTDYDLMSPPVFNGIENYRYMFTEDTLFWKSMGVTFAYVFLTIPLKLAFALGIAFVLNFKLRGIGFFGNDSNLLIVFYVQIMPDDFVMQLHRF